MSNWHCNRGIRSRADADRVAAEVTALQHLLPDDGLAMVPRRTPDLARGPQHHAR